MLGFRILWDRNELGFQRPSDDPSDPVWVFSLKLELKIEGGVLGFRILWDRNELGFQRQSDHLRVFRLWAVFLF